MVTESENTENKSNRGLTGRVVSNKMNKTITVLIERRVKHPKYGKFITRSTKLHAHDEENTCREGDIVTIVQSRPLSKTKAWRLESIVSRAEM
ncbi:30S ribosomal protein S17 [Thioflexithrix psekupsensis]|uniref:Small ribosomal subunit protein uS17 n=1 Tax=Thioflexithrix psekupsensis TaxID=1570016 RepID=A0A251XB00_9GAMM|nr:30S ribosomal protein S17 [Thioflexithrix psekupsensis]OUD15612.1 30S ribosomal protein S17 [Thioflexithrix psekupsensis]